MNIKKTIIENYENINFNDTYNTSFANECLEILESKNIQWLNMMLKF